MGYERQMSARQKALELVKKRDAIEAEMDVIFSSLTGQGGPGMTGNLVDSEGYPRADIDVHGIRIQRNRYATLKTDHKAVSDEIEKYLHIALAPPADEQKQDEARPSEQASIPAASTASEAPANTNAITAPSDSAQATRPDETASQPSAPRRPPFAWVDIVTEQSPAASAGVLVNDRIVSFGAVSLGAFATPQLAMAALPGLLREHENQSLDLVVERGDRRNPEVVTLNLTPRRWAGVGLLGCHVLPLDVSQVDSRYAPDVATAVMDRSMPRHV